MKTQLKMVKATESINGRIIAFQCSKLKSNKAEQPCIIKIINLVGEWPQGPTIIKRKNYPTLYEFVRYNKTNQSTSDFIKNTIQDLMEFSSSQIIIQLSQYSVNTIPSQIFVSNSGKRVSFWLEQISFQFFFNVLNKTGMTSLLKNFQWISPQLQQVHSNQIEYGSENFINLIQKLSLQSMTQLIDMKVYNQDEFQQIQQSLHTVFSLVNYNYKFFYPPKDATRFLKKTSGVIFLSRQKLVQQKSNKWAESVLLQGILQLRPTYALAKILAQPQGPIYLEKYVFSQKIYKSVEELYFLGSIENYFHQDNFRMDLKYITFNSRIYPEYLKLKQVQEKIQKLKKQVLILDKQQISLQNQNQNEDVDEESQEEEKDAGNKVQNQIQTLYQTSKLLLNKTLASQLEKMLSSLKNQQGKNDDISQVQSQNLKSLVEISQLRESCLHVGVSFCISCGFSNSRVSNDEKQLNEFLTMFNQGSDRFCLSCAALSIRDKIISRKERLKQQIQQSYLMIKNQTNSTLQMTPINSKQTLQSQEIKNNKIQQSQVDNKLENQSNLQVKQSSDIIKLNVENKQLNVEDKQVQKSDKMVEKISQQHHPSQILTQSSHQITSKESQISTKKHPSQANQTKQNVLLFESQNNMTQKTHQEYNEVGVEWQMKRKVLFAQKYLVAWGLMSLRLNNQATQPISPQYMHDSLQLSKIAGLLTSQNYLSDELLDIYQYYFDSMIRYMMRTANDYENQMHLVPYIQRNKSILNQRKYMKIQSNIFQSVFSKTIKTYKNQTQLFSIENQQQYFTDNLYAFLDIKLQTYKNLISQHYKTYKNVMNQQYRVNEIELKEMIVKFQQELKNSIIKTTQQFLLTSRWIILFISEYTEYKTIQINKNKIKPQDQNDIAYFINEIQFLLNLVATFVHVFNQPGQLKIIEQAQLQIFNLVFLLIQNQKLLQKHSKLSAQMDLEVVGVLICDMLDHFVSKRSSQASEDAKKLTSKHFTKLKSTLESKVKTLRVKKLLNFCNEIRSQQMKIAGQALRSISNKEIESVRDLYVDGELNQKEGYFSSLIYLEKQFEKLESSFHSNQQIKSHIASIGMVMEHCKGKSKLAMKSKSQPQHQIKFQIIYKLILQTIQKPQQAAQLVKFYRTGNKILIDLINYLICLSFQLILYPENINEVAKSVKLYIERVRHRHIKYTAKTIKYYHQVLQILEFLFKNRNSFFNIQNSTVFQIQFHMIIQIVILNALPLYNIQLAYKSELKQINKQLRHFDVNDHYNEIQDYYLKVLSYRHDKAKQKRKKQIENKKEKS